MLTPQYLAECSNDIVALYAQLETDVLKDIARRIKATGEVTASAEWQIKMAQESGMLYDDIITKVAKINDMSKADITQLFEKSQAMSMKFDNDIFKAAGLKGVSNVNSQIMSSGINKTLGEVKNMTMTTAKAGQQQFVNASTNAYMQVASGAFDYNTAITNACKEVAKKGLQSIDYESGTKISLEAGIRRNVMTGINQTAQKITEYNCDELGCNLVETSSHAGARPSHAQWQGKVFVRNGNSDKYPSFVESTGYGLASGLGGMNCRHSYYPYFEGDKPQRTKGELDSLNNETVEYEGEKLSRYDAEQGQRQNERNIRRWKRESVMLKEVGLDSSFADKKVKEWNSKAKDFSEKTGIVRQKSREKVFTGGVKKEVLTIFDGNDIVKESVFDIEKSKQEYQEFLTIVPDKNREFLEYYSSTAEYVEKLDLDNPFGYAPNADKIVYNPIHPAINNFDFNVSNTHELSHRIDNLMINSKERDYFVEAIKNESIISDEKIMRIQKYIDGNDERYSPYLSDIISALSDNKVDSMYTHSNQYWSVIGNKEQEIFANLFSIESFGDAISLGYIKAEFPSLYHNYQKLLEEF